MSDSALKDQITSDMKEAMKAKDTVKLGVIRMALAAIKQYEIDNRLTIDDTQTLALIEKMIKQRNDSIGQFKQAGRMDLVEKESSEVETLKSYLPPQLSDQEIEEHIKEAIAQSGASGMAAMGKVMGILKPQLQGKADLTKVSAKVKEILS